MNPGREIYELTDEELDEAQSSEGFRRLKALLGNAPVEHRTEDDEPIEPIEPIDYSRITREVCGG